MKSLLIVLNDMAYKTDKAFNALRLANTAVEGGTKVVVFLMGDAIYVARQEQKPPEDSPNLEEMVVDLISKGVKFKLCTTCVNARSFEPKDGEGGSCFIGSRPDHALKVSDLISGVQMSTMVELVVLVDVSEKVISF